MYRDEVHADAVRKAARERGRKNYADPVRREAIKDGGGNAHRQALFPSRHNGRAGGGPYFYRWLRLNGYPSGFQVLCANCNTAKDRPGGCPHQATEEVIDSA